MCWFHMRKNVIKQVAVHVKCKDTQAAILSDVDKLQVCSKDVFDIALNLFLTKWRDESSFIDYFKQEWKKNNPNWFEGACSLTPSTNNALESTNNVLKNEYTLRERVLLGRFLSILYEIVESTSKRYEKTLFFCHKANHRAEGLDQRVPMGENKCQN